MVFACVVALAYFALANGEGSDGTPATPRSGAREVRFEGRRLSGTIYRAPDRICSTRTCTVRAARSGGSSGSRARAGSRSLPRTTTRSCSNARGSGGDRLELANLDGADALPGNLIDPHGQGPSLSRSGKLLYSVVQYRDNGSVIGDKVYLTTPRPGAHKRVLLDPKRSVWAS